MKILVTGGAGFIGSHVVDAYVEAGHSVAVFDNFSNGKRENIHSKATVFEGDLRNSSQIEKALQDFSPEVVNHHAAQVSVVHAVGHPDDDAERNIVGTVNLLEGIRSCPSVQRVVYASSGGAMYGDPVEIPCKETTTPLPISPYGLSKYVAEQYCWLYHKMYGTETLVLRYSNVYGPRQDPHGEAGVCAIFCQRMSDKQSVKIFGDGSQKRDYVYVGDIAKANLASLSGQGGAFNISTGIETSTQEVFDSIKDVVGYTLEPEYAPERFGEIQRSILDPSLAADRLGWKAVTGFETASDAPSTGTTPRERKVGRSGYAKIEHAIRP